MPQQKLQSGENYFNSGQACYESAFLFNKYSKQERIDKKSISLISSRIKNKLKHKKNQFFLTNTKFQNTIINFCQKLRAITYKISIFWYESN